MKLLFLFTIISYLNLNSQELNPSKTFTEVPITRSIEYFSYKDLSHDIYEISITSNKPDELIKELNSQNDKKLRIEIGDIKTDIIKDSATYDVDNNNMINFNVVAYYKLPTGKTQIKLYSKTLDSIEVLESSKEFEMLESNDLPGKQPLVTSITPEAGVRGDTITMKGINFGKSVDNISIHFFEESKTQNGDEVFLEIAENKPFYLTPPINEEQEIKFNIPLRKDLLKGSQIRKSLKVRLFVSGRPSNYVPLAILPKGWRYAAGVVGLFIVTIFMIFIYFILRSQIQSSQSQEVAGFDGKGGGIKRPSFVHFIESILSDKATNTYSLSRFQAFAWTITAIGSYIYVALSQGVLLRNGKIPDFNPTLVVLMTISYGGLLAANGLGSKKPKNEIKSKPAELSNLFCEGGNVDLSRLQLFGFTVVSIIVYIFNLAYGNPLEGLPDVPSTLLGLMGVSQSGYLGGKSVGKSISINVVTPDYIQVSQEGVKISVIGSGFTSGTKILLSGMTPIESNFISSTEIDFILPRVDSPAILSFDLIPPGASPFHCDADISIVDVGQSGYIVNFTPEEKSI